MKETENVVGKSNSKGLVLGIAVAIAVVVFAVLGTAIYFVADANSPEKKLAKQLDLGNKYLEDEDYERAIAAFDKAIDIDPKCVDAYLGKAEAYVALVDYEEAIAVLVDGYDETEDKAIKKQLKKYVEEYVDGLVEDGEIEEAIDFMEDIQDEIDDDLFEDYISELIYEDEETDDVEAFEIEEEIDNSPEVEAVYDDYIELNKLATVCAQYYGASYDAENIDYDDLTVFLWWYEVWGNEYVEDYGYDDIYNYNIKYISYDNAVNVINSYFYGNINMPQNLYDDDVIDDWLKYDTIYYGDGGFYATCPSFGLETDYANLYSIEKLEPNHYLVSFKKYYVEMGSGDCPDDLYVNSYTYTIEELEQYSDIIWTGESTIEFILTDEGYRIYKLING